jgi:flavin reductase (DIM6/NTAB) family NADH-FMN oxidoreductase RutF
MTEVDFNSITSYQRYKLMASLIVPRPIALVTTLSPASSTRRLFPCSTCSAKTRRY